MFLLSFFPSFFFLFILTDIEKLAPRKNKKAILGESLGWYFGIGCWFCFISRRFFMFNYCFCRVFTFLECFISSFTCFIKNAMVLRERFFLPQVLFNLHSLYGSDETRKAPSSILHYTCSNWVFPSCDTLPLILSVLANYVLVTKRFQSVGSIHVLRFITEHYVSLPLALNQNFDNFVYCLLTTSYCFNNLILFTRL